MVSNVWFRVYVKEQTILDPREFEESSYQYEEESEEEENEMNTTRLENYTIPV